MGSADRKKIDEERDSIVRQRAAMAKTIAEVRDEADERVAEAKRDAAVAIGRAESNAACAKLELWNAIDDRDRKIRELERDLAKARHRAEHGGVEFVEKKT